MEFGITVNTIADIYKAKAANFRYVVLGGTLLSSLDRVGLNDLRNALFFSGMECRTINRYCREELKMAGDGYSHQKAKEYAKELAAKCAFLGCTSVGIGSPKSRVVTPEEVPHALNDFAEFVFVTTDVFSKYNITVCVEPLSQKYCRLVNTMEEGEFIINRQPRPGAKLIADFYNLELDGNNGLDLSKWLPHLFHIHVSDDNGSIFGRSYLKQEKKAIHIKRLKNLISSGYCGDVTLEIDTPVDIEQAAQSLAILQAARQA